MFLPFKSVCEADFRLICELDVVVRQPDVECNLRSGVKLMAVIRVFAMHLFMSLLRRSSIPNSILC